MGTCGAKENLSPQEKEELARQQKRNKEIETQLNKDISEDMQYNKLLLLGAGESGKSTLFKQMISIYGEGFPENVRKTYISVIHNNTLSAMKTLCEQQVLLQEHGIDTSLKSEQAAGARDVVVAHKADGELDEKLAGAINTLWADTGIQTTYEHRSRYQLTDSAAYFFQRIHTIAAVGYVPTEQDVLRSRVRTTGIVEQSFLIDNNRFKMFDVGGQRAERKKWIHCFQDVTAVLFVAAISEYDMVLFEDENTNRMIEALNLFDEICNSKWFTNTSMILFLNKKDLFAQKIEKVPLTVCFPEYDGMNAYEPALDYISRCFAGLNKNPKKELYLHVTTATDSDNMRVVFNAVKDIVVRQSLRQGGLLN